MTEESAPSEVGYYYPEPYWLTQEGGWIKGLLLFFDQVAILLPEYMRGRHADADPTLVEPLEDQGLLRVIEPEWFVDEATTMKLADIIEALIEGGAFDDLSDGGRFAELSMSRMGYAALDDVAHRVHVELERRGPRPRARTACLFPCIRWSGACIWSCSHSSPARLGLDTTSTSTP